MYSLRGFLLGRKVYVGILYMGELLALAVNGDGKG